MAILPSITFEVNLGLFLEEDVGPSTNLRTPTMWNSIINQSTPVARSAFVSTWLPGILNGENRQLKNGDQFTVVGQKALYIRDNFAVGYASAGSAWLEIV